jgi:oligopeptide transport system substrate-binding protein
VVGIEKDAAIPRITLARNEHYWGGHAKLDGIEYVVMDAEPGFEAYMRGELDFIHPSEEQVPEIETDPVLSQELLTMPSTSTGVFLLNLTREPFTDKQVREAFAYAFDRSAYCREVESGFCTPTSSWIPQGVPGSIVADAYAFDPDRARQALAASSYGGPETLPEIQWYVDEGDTWEVRQADWLADQFRQVLDVELVVTPVEEEALDAMFTDSATWPQMASTFWYSSLPDPHEWQEFWTCGSEYFAVYIGYCNPDYDALVDQSNRELDPEKRLALAQESQRTLLADAPSIFVYNPTNWWLVKPAVTGYSPTAPQQQWPGWWNPLAVDVVRTA